MLTKIGLEKLDELPLLADVIASRRKSEDASGKLCREKCRRPNVSLKFGHSPRTEEFKQIARRSVLVLCRV